MPLWLAGLIAVLCAAAWIFGKWKRWRGAGALLFLSALSYILLAYILFAGID